jgi:hypothetical protein
MTSFCTICKTALDTKTGTCAFVTVDWHRLAVTLKRRFEDEPSPNIKRLIASDYRQVLRTRESPECVDLEEKRSWRNGESLTHMYPRSPPGVMVER